MNKRQAKKAFKKKYGVNPEEFAKTLNGIDFSKSMQQVAEAVNKIAQQLPGLINEMARKMTAAVNQIDTEQLKEYLSQYEEKKNEIVEEIAKLKEDKN